jgi:alpha-galactosidase
MMVRKKIILVSLMVLVALGQVSAQELHEYKDSVVIGSSRVRFKADLRSGKVSYHYSNGTDLENTVAYVVDVHAGMIASADLENHHYQIDQVKDDLGIGIRFTFKHEDVHHQVVLEQHITLYPELGYLLIDVVASGANGLALIETRNVSPLAVLPAYQGHYLVPGDAPRILGVPFDNDDWVNVTEQSWPLRKGIPASGISYEFTSLYDNVTFSGIVIGSVNHDTWKTGIAYNMNAEKGKGDTLCVYGGAATEDNPKLPPSYGGLNGTHDHAPHGTLVGSTVSSPLIYMAGPDDIRDSFSGYGKLNALINGRQEWQGDAPVYWNSFGVEGVLGYTHVMMPAAVGKISDFIRSLTNFNAYAKPVLSVDSYDQDIYTTSLLASLSRYAAHNNQQMGFYFIPFAMWTWKNTVNTQQIPGSNYLLKDVVLRDKNNEPIMYKSGDWCAYAMDPTHPAIRAYVIQQLQKAKAINAKFLKIDFLTAGALESVTRYDTTVRTGMQAYNRGMKMLKALADSILGKDIFITQAISPMFPSQYAHTRFVSTDVYSHLRNDEPGFPNWGSTESSLANGSHMGWVQGTLWPFTNLDVTIMKNFQHNPELSEQEIKVRIYALMVMGSILGDGSDYRDKVAADRAKKFLDNKNVAAFFSRPKAFLPLKYADGDSFDQRMEFYLGDTSRLLAVFNFDKQKPFQEEFKSAALHLDATKTYQIRDFLTDAPVGEIKQGQASFLLNVGTGDAIMVKLIAINQ